MPEHIWRVRFDLEAWTVDLRAASSPARAAAERWRTRIEVAGGIPQSHLRATRTEDRLPLPNCVKARLPNPASEDPHISPWGAVLRGAIDDEGAHLAFVAFGIRHPPAGSRSPSVYERAHRRLGSGPDGRAAS